VSATHSCMTIRGALKGRSVMNTTHFTGVYNEQAKRQEFWEMLK
jgi:GTP cyclohydrolase I